MIMGRQRWEILSLYFVLLFNHVVGERDAGDFSALSSLKSTWKNTPPSWVGSDPCKSQWEGIYCVGLKGTLTGDIGKFTELQTLDLSQNKGLTGSLPPEIGNLKNLKNLFLVDCNFYGPIPDSIGSLTKLFYMSLASNNFDGPIPPSMGNLKNIDMLDFTQNKLSGPLPVSDSTSPGLDLLVQAKHFHFGKNQFSGIIPEKLFNNNTQLKHLLIDSNSFQGKLPSTIEQLHNLEVIRVDKNQFTGNIEVDFSLLQKISELYLSNNQFTGPIPNFTGLSALNYLDISNNSFDPSPIPQWLSSLQSLNSIFMQRTQLQGQIPPSIFKIPFLESLDLSQNNIIGTLKIPANFSQHLQMINLQQNSITGYDVKAKYGNIIMLQNNPFCQVLGSANNLCKIEPKTSSYSTKSNNCTKHSCKSNLISSPNCVCADPIRGVLRFSSIGFSDLGNSTYYVALESAIMGSIKEAGFPVASLSLNAPSTDENGYLELEIDLFPFGSRRFNRTAFSLITSQLNNITFFTRPSYFGPMYFALVGTDYFRGEKSTNARIVIAVAIGVGILLLLLIITGFYALRQRNRADRAVSLIDPFASWDEEQGKGSRPEIKGVKSFTLEDVRRFTDNFSSSSILGSGGFGKVYKGVLTDGTLVAIKRAKEGSKQGSPEFKNEIELLSRVHHRNLVTLLGFCYEQGELLLIYEYISNGSLHDAITGKSGIDLSWSRRLKLALDSARGLAYLHELVDPPIIHRDVKSANILLDEQLVAKVSDFGFSILVENADSELTQIKGTLGYLDPDYFLSQQPTEKSDVYSFGVIMLELATGKGAISEGKNIVSEVKIKVDRKKGAYNLEKLLDPVVYNDANLCGIEKLIDLALRCVDGLRQNRPTMGEVVKEIENIMQMVAKNEVNQGSKMDNGSARFSSYNDFMSKNMFEYSGSFPGSSGIELK